MSAEAVELIRRSFETWNSGDSEQILPLYHEDAVFHSAVTDLVGKTYRGHDALRGYIDDADDADAVSSWRFELEGLIDAGDRVVSFHRAICVGRGSGIEVTRKLAGVYEVRDGLIASEWIYLDRDEALRAAGLTPTA